MIFKELQCAIYNIGCNQQFWFVYVWDISQVHIDGESIRDDTEQNTSWISDVSNENQTKNKQPIGCYSFHNIHTSQNKISLCGQYALL